MEVCWLEFSVFALIQLSCLMKCKKNALLYSQLPNNTLLLLSTHPPYFSPHTSEAILSTHCHTSTGSVRYLLCPAAFLESSCCIFTLTFHWHAAFLLFVSYSHHISHLATKWEIGHTMKLAFIRNQAGLSFGRRTPLNDHLSVPSTYFISVFYTLKKYIMWLLTHAFPNICFSKAKPQESEITWSFNCTMSVLLV